MEYFHRYHVLVLLTAWVTTEPTLSHETSVLSLYHNPHVLRLNTKEFLIVGKSDVLISCGISIPQESEYHVEIVLRNGDGVVAEMASGKETHLYWKLSPSEISNLSCRVTCTVRGQSSTIEMNGVMTYSVTNGVHCYPGFYDSVFLMNELAQIFCVVKGGGYEWYDLRSMDFDFQNDQEVRFPDKLRVIVNYVKLASEEGGSARCSHESGETCTIGNFRLERDLSIFISPTTFSEDISLGFRCATNLPTEYISWYIELFGNDNMMQVEPWSEIPWQYLITHDRYTSELVFNDSNVKGVKSVLCSTSRAGYFVQAMTNNETSDTNNEENHDDITITMPTVTAVYSDYKDRMTARPPDGNSDMSDEHFDEKGDMVDKQDSDDIGTYIPTSDAANMSVSRSSTGLVAVVIILSLVCITLGAVTLLLTYKMQRLKAKTTNVHPNVSTTSTVVTSSKATEDPYYYATSTDSGNNANSGEEKSPQGTTYMTLNKYNEGLSTDIHDYGAVVVENNAYEAT